MEYRFEATLKGSNELLDIVAEKLLSFSQEFSRLFFLHRDEKELLVTIISNQFKVSSDFYDKYGEWPWNFLLKLMLDLKEPFEFVMDMDSEYRGHNEYKITSDGKEMQYYKRDEYYTHWVPDIVCLYIEMQYMYFFFPDLIQEIDAGDWTVDECEDEEFEKIIRSAIKKQRKKFPKIVRMMTEVLGNEEDLYSFLYDELYDYSEEGEFFGDIEDKLDFAKDCKPFIDYCEAHVEELQNSGIECPSFYEFLKGNYESVSEDVSVLNFSKEEFYEKYDSNEILYAYCIPGDYPIICLNPPEWKPCAKEDFFGQNKENEISDAKC